MSVANQQSECESDRPGLSVFPTIGLKDVCCSCWELTFTEGPVKGQKMTLQVTNGSAGDIGE